MAEVNLGNFLDKAHEGKGLREILDLPVSALQGVSNGDADALKAAFGVRTVRDLGRNKFFKLAQSLVEMAEFADAPPPAKR